jgi:hypothetical protein
VVPAAAATSEYGRSSTTRSVTACRSSGDREASSSSRPSIQLSSGDDACDSCFAGDEDAQPLARRSLERPLANGRDEHVACDRVQPSRCGPIREIAEAIKREPGLREGLGSQVECRITISTPREVEPVDALGVPVVELAKGRRIGLRVCDQLRVRPHSASGSDYTG